MEAFGIFGFMFGMIAFVAASQAMRQLRQLRQEVDALRMELREKRAGQVEPGAAADGGA